MLPNKGLVDALYERMFGDHHQENSNSHSWTETAKETMQSWAPGSSTKDVSGDSIQQNSWAQNEIRQRIIDAPNNKHAQRKHDLLEERTAGFKSGDEGFGNDQQQSQWSAGQNQEWSTAGQNQEWSGAPQSQNWSGIGQDIQAQGLSGGSFSGYGQSGVSQQDWQGGIDSAPRSLGGQQGLGQQGLGQQSWTGTSQYIPLSQGQQFGQGTIPTYEEQRFAPPLPNRQF